MGPSSALQLDSPMSLGDDNLNDRHRKIFEKSKSLTKAKEIILPERPKLTPDASLYTISRPVTTVIDTAHALLYAVNGSTDFAFRYRLVSRALAIGRNLSREIVNPLSVIRPPTQDIQSTRRLLLICHSAMIQLLCQESFLRHRELIYEHLSQVVRLEGQEMMYAQIPEVREAIWPGMISAIRSQGWTIPQRVREWIRVASTIPAENYFVAGRLFSHQMSIRMEMDALEECLEAGNLDESKEAIKMMQHSADVIKECLNFIVSGHAQCYLPPHPGWCHPEVYQKIADSILPRFERVKRDVDTRLLLRQGDALLALATDEVRRTDADYFGFQAKLALDSYRAGYRVCVGHVERNLDLEDVCLVAMKRVLEGYLELEDCVTLSVAGPEMILQNVDRVLKRN